MSTIILLAADHPTAADLDEDVAGVESVSPRRVLGMSQEAGVDARKMGWNLQDAWVWSDDIVNPQIIDEETFTAVQRVMAARGRGPARHKPHRARRSYVLRGSLHCGICQRRMEGSWNNGEPYYRCRFGEEYALANHVQHPRNVYLREVAVLPRMDTWLGKYFAPHRRAGTIAAIAAAVGGEPAEDASTALAEQAIAECDRKLAHYRTTLEALGDDTDPTIVAGWIAEAQKQREAAQAQLRHAPRQEHVSKADIAASTSHRDDQASTPTP